MAAPHAIRVRTADGWQDLALTGPPGPPGADGRVYDSDQIGVVKAWTGKTIPVNWALANGQRFTQAAYPQGYTFAKQEADAGNPLWTYRTTPDISFTVPNLTDKFLLASGANLLGDSGGEVSHVLTPAETAMKAHNHGGGIHAHGVNDPSHVHSNTNGPYLEVSGSVSTWLSLYNDSNYAVFHAPNTAAAFTGITIQNSAAIIATETAANGTAHNNMPPYVVLAQIVKIKGAQIDSDGDLVGPPGTPGEKWFSGIATPGLESPVIGAVIGDWYLCTEDGTVWERTGTDGAGGQIWTQRANIMGPPGADSTVPGPAGPPGQGVPSGGASSQVLRKHSAADYDTEWANPTGGSGLPEVYIGPDPPTPRDAQVIWVDTDEAAPASLNIGLDVWHVVGQAGEPVFTNGWTPGAEGVRFRKDQNGRVFVRGQFSAGTAATSAFTLPIGYRPPRDMYFTALNTAGSAGNYTWVNTAGNVVQNVSGMWIDVSFDTETVAQAASVAAQPIEGFHIVGNPGEPALVNGWIAVDAPKFRKYPDGVVRISGMARSGSAPSVFVLPVGYRPAQTQRIATTSNNGGTTVLCELMVLTTGEVQIYGSAATTFVSLYIEFDTETLTTYSTGAIIPSAQSMPVSMDSVHVVGAAGEPAFQNGWVNNAAGMPTRFRKFPDGRVRLQGQVQGGTAGNSIFTLPASHRPPARMDFPCGGNNAPAIVVILADGSVISRAADGNTRIELDGVEFDTETTLVTASIAVQPIDSWHTVGAAGEPAFSASVSNGSDQVAGFRKYPDGRVRLRGWVNCPAAAGSGLFTLPAGYRPPRDFTRHSVVDLAGSIGYVYVRADGVVIKQSTQTQICIDGVEFDTETVSNYATAVVQGITPAINPAVSALPSSPVDGQECYYRFVPAVTPATTIPIIWHLRWDAAAACWLPVGQQEPVIAGYVPGTNVSMGINAWGTYDANDPRVTTPRAGVYEIEAGIGEAYGAVNTVISGIGINGIPNTTTTGEGSAAQYGGQSGGSQQLKLPEFTLVVNDIVRQYYYAFAGSGPQNVVMRNRYIQIRPKKITG